MKLIECTPRGIKCDNPNCDFKDWSVTYQEYPDYINKPCPKCGSNLLTRECFNNIEKMVHRTQRINNFFEKIFTKKQKEKMMNRGIKTAVADVDARGHITNIKDISNTK